MKRRCFHIASALSLLLLLAAIALQVRSYWVRDSVAFARAGGHGHSAMSILGRVHVLTSLDGRSKGWLSYSSGRLGPNAIWNAGHSSYPVKAEWHMGFIWQTYSRYHMGMGDPYVSHQHLFVMPYWFPVLVFGILPAAWTIRLLRRSRRGHKGLCPDCGYDLRATPERCPECGKEIAATSPA